jgi:hypothetical protein
MKALPAMIALLLLAHGAAAEDVAGMDKIVQVCAY